MDRVTWPGDFPWLYKAFQLSSCALDCSSCLSRLVSLSIKAKTKKPWRQSHTSEAFHKTIFWSKSSILRSELTTNSKKLSSTSGFHLSARALETVSGVENLLNTQTYLDRGMHSSAWLLPVWSCSSSNGQELIGKTGLKFGLSIPADFSLALSTTRQLFFSR